MSLQTPSAAINDHEPPLLITPFGIVAYSFVGQPLSKQLYAIREILLGRWWLRGGEGIQKFNFQAAGGRAVVVDFGRLDLVALVTTEWANITNQSSEKFFNDYPSVRIIDCTG